MKIKNELTGAGRVRAVTNKDHTAIAGEQSCRRAQCLEPHQSMSWNRLTHVTATYQLVFDQEAQAYRVQAP